MVIGCPFTELPSTTTRGGAGAGEGSKGREEPAVRTGPAWRAHPANTHATDIAINRSQIEMAGTFAFGEG
jgi:hypothetical protein